VVSEEKTLTGHIEKGMPSDAEIRFERESEQAPGITPGDVIFKLKVSGREGGRCQWKSRVVVMAPAAPWLLAAVVLLLVLDRVRACASCDLWLAAGRAAPPL